MADHYDSLIRGGTLVDGSGDAPRTGDVAIRDGIIVALGEVAGTADRVFEADGHVVSPGFVDIHTHYDAQILWDQKLSISPWHGVTTVVMGNCGFGIAPTRPAHRDLILRTLENVEGMSLEVLRAGVAAATGTDDWPFESFPEYLDVIEERGSSINFAALLGHTPLRMYVMGEASTERAATEEEVAEMKVIVSEAMAAGAIGFASSKAPPHVGYDARPVPSRLAEFDELQALCDAMGKSGKGTLQAALGPGLLFDEMTKLQKSMGRPISWTALLADAFGPDGHRGILEMHEKLQSDGIDITPQVSCRPLMMEYQFSAPFPHESLELFVPVLRADHEEKKRIYADAKFRQAFRNPTERSITSGSWESTVITESRTDPSLAGRLLLDVAEERGVDSVDLALDLAIADDLETRFRVELLNITESSVAELLQHPAVMLGLSDAGAHASQLCDAGFATHLLGYWVREKEVLSLAAAVRLLTSRSAEVFGIHDRGRLAVGMAADITIFDPATVGCGPLRRVNDLPGGADRLVADAHGVKAVIVNGQLIREDDEDRIASDAALPGRLLRNGGASG